MPRILKISLTTGWIMINVESNEREVFPFPQPLLCSVKQTVLYASSFWLSARHPTLTVLTGGIQIRFPKPPQLVLFIMMERVPEFEVFMSLDHQGVIENLLNEVTVSLVGSLIRWIYFYVTLCQSLLRLSCQFPAFCFWQLLVGGASEIQLHNCFNTLLTVKGTWGHQTIQNAYLCSHSQCC